MDRGAEKKRTMRILPIETLLCENLRGPAMLSPRSKRE